MSLRFGTDGVRGPADELTDPLVTALGRAAARVIVPSAPGVANAAGVANAPGVANAAVGRRVVIGRDTRASGPRLEQALAAGLAVEGVSAELIGVVPTPTVAWVAATQGVAAAMISASHNPWSDNGIKFFAPGGHKLADDVEARLEAELDRVLADDEDAATVGAAASLPGAADVAGWEDALVASLDGRRLEGLRVVIDCANGAASVVAPEVLRRLGVQVEVLHAGPDGRNINDGCGSTHPSDLQAAVRGGGAAVGLAFDGDADRVLAVDETGALVDGDHLIAMCAIDRRERGRLRGDTVVVTVMANLGFRLAMAEHGIRVVETGVGDRYVLEAIESGGYSLGGEQSGHVIFRDLATTGDGLLTGLQVLDLVVRSGRPLSVLAAEAMTRLPQVLLNVRVSQPHPDIATTIAADIATVEAELADRGRVLVRPSGTEPLVRVMVEATDASRAEAAARQLVAAVERACGA